MIETKPPSPEQARVLETFGLGVHIWHQEPAVRAHVDVLVAGWDEAAMNELEQRAKRVAFDQRGGKPPAPVGGGPSDPIGDGRYEGRLEVRRARPASVSTLRTKRTTTGRRHDAAATLVETMEAGAERRGWALSDLARRFKSGRLPAAERTRRDALAALVVEARERGANSPPSQR